MNPLRPAALFALTVTLLPAGSSRLEAQPQPIEEGVRREQARQSARYAWRELQRQTAPVELDDPAQAIATYQAFYEKSGHLSVEVAVSVTSRIAQLWGHDLENPTKAGEIYAWALEQWGEMPYKERLQNEAALMKKLREKTEAPKAQVEVEAPVVMAPVQAGGGVAPVALAPVQTRIGVAPIGIDAVKPLRVDGMEAEVRLVPVAKTERLLSPSSKPPFAAAKAVALPNFTGVGGQSLGATLVVEEMRVGGLSVQEAWERGSLTVEDALALLEQTGLYGSTNGQQDPKTRRGLVRLILDQMPHLLDAPEKLSPTLRLWIGEALGDASDARAVPLLEGVLAEFKERAPVQNERDSATAFLASEKLAWFYRDQRQYEKSAQIWVSFPPYVTNTEWMIPDALWQAGRMYLWAGKPEQAESYFAQVNTYGNQLYISLANYDKVGALLHSGKNAEARQLVNQALQVVDKPGGRAIQLMLLAQTSYLMGDFAEAQESAQGCLDELGKIKKVNPAVGFDVVGNTAQDLLRWSQIWQKRSLICSPEKLAHRVASPSEKPVWKTRLNVRSFKAVPLSIKCNDPRVKCTVVPIVDDPWFPRQKNRFVEQTIEIEVPLTTVLQTELHISSAQLPGAKCDIPLQISS